MQVRVSLLIGNPRPGSRTAAASGRLTNALCASLAQDGTTVSATDVVDLSLLGRHLLDPDADPEPVRRATAAVLGARLLVVASPTFKATYSGLLKVFLDALPQRALTGVVAVPVMLAAKGSHRYAVETYLRPLLVELGAAVPVNGVSVVESELDVLDELIAKWSVTAVPTLAALLSRVGADG
jgi:FMN reductase